MLLLVLVEDMELREKLKQSVFAEGAGDVGMEGEGWVLLGEEVEILALKEVGGGIWDKERCV